MFLLVSAWGREMDVGQGGKVWEKRHPTGRNSAGSGEWKAQKGPNAERAQNRNFIESSMPSMIT